VLDFGKAKNVAGSWKTEKQKIILGGLRSSMIGTKVRSRIVSRGRGRGGVLPEKLGGDVWPTSQNP